MDLKVIERRLINGSAFDMNVHSTLTSDNGWKISIQGKNVSDSLFLCSRLYNYLTSKNIPFKVATWNRYALRNTNPEQSFKALTIYCPDGHCFNSIMEEVYTLTVDYKGWQDIHTPTSYEHYAGGIFFRCDRNNGIYMPAK